MIDVTERVKLFFGDLFTGYERLKRDNEELLEMLNHLAHHAGALAATCSMCVKINQRLSKK